MLQRDRHRCRLANDVGTGHTDSGVFGERTKRTLSCLDSVRGLRIGGGNPGTFPPR